MSLCTNRHEESGKSIESDDDFEPLDFTDCDTESENGDADESNSDPDNRADELDEWVVFGSLAPPRESVKASQEPEKGQHLVGQCPGAWLCKGYKSPLGSQNYFVASGPPNRYFVGSCPGGQAPPSAAPLSNCPPQHERKALNYDVGAHYFLQSCPGTLLQHKEIPSRHLQDASAAYREAYSASSMANVDAFGEKREKAMAFKPDPRSKYAARSLVRDRTRRQMERAQGLRSRARLAEIQAGRDLLLRRDFAAVCGNKFSQKLFSVEPKTHSSKKVSPPPTRFYSDDLLEFRQTSTVMSRDSLLREAYAMEDRVRQAQTQVRDLAIGGRKGSGSGIMTGDEAANSREQQLRNACFGYVVRDNMFSGGVCSCSYQGACNKEFSVCDNLPFRVWDDTDETMTEQGTFGF